MASKIKVFRIFKDNSTDLEGNINLWLSNKKTIRIIETNFITAFNFLVYTILYYEGDKDG